MCSGHAAWPLQRDTWGVGAPCYTLAPAARQRLVEGMKSGGLVLLCASLLCGVSLLLRAHTFRPRWLARRQPLGWVCRFCCPRVRRLGRHEDSCPEVPTVTSRLQAAPTPRGWLRAASAHDLPYCAGDGTPVLH